MDRRNNLLVDQESKLYLRKYALIPFSYLTVDSSFAGILSAVSSKMI